MCAGMCAHTPIFVGGNTSLFFLNSQAYIVYSASIVATGRRKDKRVRNRVKIHDAAPDLARAAGQPKGAIKGQQPRTSQVKT